MKIFYFQAKKELNEKQTAINLLKQANKAMIEEIKDANQKRDEYKNLYEELLKKNKIIKTQNKKKEE
jgi:hypothetical protein